MVAESKIFIDNTQSKPGGLAVKPQEAAAKRARSIDSPLHHGGRRHTASSTSPHGKPVNAMPNKSLHRMLSPKGNSSMDNLAATFDAVRKYLKVSLKAQAVSLQKVA